MRLLFAVSIYLSLRLMLPEILAQPILDTLREKFDFRPSAHNLAGFTQTKNPVGIGKLIDLTFLADPTVGVVLHWLALAALVTYAAGLVLPLSTLVIFLIHCAIFTLNNSTGATHHGYQILTIVLLAQVCVLWAPLILRLLPKIRPYLPSHEPGLHRRDLFVYYSQIAIAGAYVVAGLSKVLRSHVKWIIDSPDVAVQIVKSHSQKYYEYLDPQWADMGMSYAQWITAHPWLTRLMLTGGLVLELFAFLLLINRAWAAFIGISIIAMHLVIGQLMALHFPQNIQGDFAMLVNAPFWIFAIVMFIARREKTPLR